MTGVYSHDDDPRTNGVTPREFFDAIQRLQNFISERADKTDAMIASHAAEDNRMFEQVRLRVAIIENERSNEKAQTLKRATWIGMGSAAAMTGLWKVIDHLLK